MSLPARFADKAWYRLTAHFFVGLFDFGVLSDAGSDAFRRVLIGIVAIVLTLGLLLARMYTIGTAGPSSPDRYRLAASAGEALMIGLPMLVVAFATVLVSDSLFPDDTDFRVLLVLPISRRVVFLSKLLSLALFAGLFIVSTHVALLPLFLRMSAGRWGDPFVPRFAAHAVASLGASVFVVLALTAINGVLLLGVPRARLQTASTAVRSLLLCALVLSVPLVSRLPGIGARIASESRLLYWAPPLWFVGVQQVLLGHATPYFTRLAAIAATAFVSSLALAVGSYSYLYRRFDRVMMRPADASTGSRRRAGTFIGRMGGAPFSAISAFTRLTLARSSLHQGVFVAISACGAGLVINSFIGVMDMGRVRPPESQIVNAVLAAPFTLVFVTVLAVRAALVLPIELRANWVFRMTEDSRSRGEQLGAVVHTVARFGVLWPVVVLLPVQWAVLGPRALIGAAIAYLAGLVLVELHMGDWLRIPFTCSYMPGKRFVGHTMLIGLAAFVAFTFLGWAFALYASRNLAGGLVVMAILGAVAYQRRRHRLWLWRGTALVFEDVLPNEVEPLRLSAY